MHFARLANTLLKTKESSSKKLLISVWQNYGHESVAQLFLAHPVCLIAGQFKMMYLTRCDSKRFYYDFRWSHVASLRKKLNTEIDLAKNYALQS